MNPLKQFIAIWIFCLAIGAISAAAQTSAFTYQGKLTDTSAAANGNYDFVFKLFDADQGGTQIGSGAACNGAASGGADAVCDNVPVTGGIFTVNLDFGVSAFTGGGLRFLEISVRPGANTGAYTTLAPRQQVTSAPFSVKTLNAASADALSAACVLCVTDAQIQTIDGGKVTGTVASATTAANVSGIVPIANGGTGSATKNFVDLSTNQTVGGDKNFTGILSGSGSGLTNLSGANLQNGSVSSAKIADGAITENKLSSVQRQLLADARDSSFVGLLRWDLLKTQTFSLASAPNGIAFDGENMWTANSNGTVSKIRASDGEVLDNFKISGSSCKYLAFDGANIWITANNEMFIIRAADGEVQFILSINNPQGIAFDGTNMWIAFGNNRIRKINISLKSSEDFDVGQNPVQVAFDGANVWVTSSTSNFVTKLRASDGANLGSFNISGASFGIAFDGVNIWVTPFGGNRIKRLRASDGFLLSDILVGSVGNTLRGIVFDGANLWATNFSTNSIVKLRAADGTNLGSFPTGNAPVGAAFDGSRIWVTNSGDNSVAKMPSFPR